MGIVAKAKGVNAEGPLQVSALLGGFSSRLHTRMIPTGLDVNRCPALDAGIGFSGIACTEACQQLCKQSCLVTLLGNFTVYWANLLFDFAFYSLLSPTKIALLLK